MLIIKTHLKALMQFLDITKENKVKFIWHIHMYTRKTLQQPVNQWEMMLIHLAKNKSDFTEQRDWQNITKNRASGAHNGGIF